MSEEKAQESVQESQAGAELAAESQDNSTDSRERELLREIMQKKERLQKWESKYQELESTVEKERQKRLEEQEEWKTLAEERQSKIDKLTPVVELAKAQEKEFRNELLSDFSDDDKKAFSDLPLIQLRAVHKRLISKTGSVPNVDNSSPAGAEGYSDIIAAAKDYQKGLISEQIYKKVKEAFKTVSA